jgi:hypothetical protein
MPGSGPEEVARHLGLDDAFGPWLQHLHGLGDVPALPLLEAGKATALLTRLGLAAADAAEIVAMMPALKQDAALWWLAERCHFDLTRNLGDENAPPFQTPQLPEHRGAVGKLFWLYVFLAAIEDVRRWHARHGIPDDVSWATLSPLGGHISRYRREHGRWGVEVPFFFTLAFRGVLFQVGRLGYIPYRLCTGAGGPLFWYDPAAVEALGPGFRPGDPALSIHVPAEAPLDAAECGASLRRAGDVFASHFPPGTPMVGTCTSWLLDPQLAEYLPAGSNIVRFQRRFQLVPGVRIDNESIVSYLRGSSGASSDPAPRETALQRAVASHLAAGKDWHLRTGWLDLRMTLDLRSEPSP